MKNTRRGKAQIRKSTDADLDAIHSWLVDQKARNIPDSFLCNWDLIQNGHKNGKLLVYIDGESNQPIAFRLGSLIGPGILEVRHDKRGGKIGSRFVRYLIARHRRRDECILEVQCEPSSSIPFWKRMGFTLFNRNGRENYAYQILEKRLRIPSDGKPVSITIRFFPEDRKWRKDISAYSTASPTATMTSDGVIHLSDRVIFFRELYGDSYDPVVEIEIKGRIQFCDKAKYPEARSIGIKSCSGGFYIDNIILQSS